MRRGMSFPEDRLVQHLLRHDGVGRLVVGNWFRSAPFAAARAILKRDAQPFPHDRATLHQPMRLRRRDPAELSALERTYHEYDRLLQRGCERAGLVKPAVITAHPLVAGFAPLEWAGSVTYYATDDWGGSPEYRCWWPAFDEAYRRMRDKRHRVCAVSEAIIQNLRPTGPHAVIPNGVDGAEWRERPTGGSWLATLPAPRLLYLGTLDSRLDPEIVIRLAARFARGSVALVGPVLDREHVKRCSEPANVHVHPPVSRHEVPSLLADADVCIIPHVHSRFTAAMSPLKLYEYLAAGRPVATVDLPPIRAIDRRVIITPDSADFNDAAAKALALGPAPEADRQEFIARHSWRSLHDRLIDLALAD